MIVDKAIYVDGRREPSGNVGSALDWVREHGSGFVWVGTHSPGGDEFTRIAEQMHLHPLAVEDALKGNQRAKIDFYETSMFVVLKTLHYIDATSDVETGELMVFVGDDFVMSVRRGEMLPLQGMRRRLEADPARLAEGPMVVFHAIIDQVVDNYRHIDTELARDLDDIEEAVLGGKQEVDTADIYRLKREVLEFKRGTIPLVAPLRRLTSGDESHLVPESLRPFYADVLDHLLGVVDHAETYDRLLTDILTARLTQMSLQQNEDMRRISSWAAMAAVPTMIAGVYGMNFDNMPELHTEYGYFVVIAVIVLACTLLYRRLRKAGWL
ncbi:MAG: magnesium and cobalt transport protein CorA [Dermatophilus congolensis]|nr:magnesium and cobalt transport protein CorA [Dermatophilus congolensis]